MNSHVFTNTQRFYLIIKRILDFLFAFSLLFVLLPLLFIVYILVKLDSRGPAIFKQKRPGKMKKIFTIYKFRTMRLETTKDGIHLSDNERKTKIGNLLRKTSIDELPQLINILKGEMSFIGPRPFLINDLGTYTSEQEVRFKILPGITSWTAINGRNSLTVQEKYNMEIFYVKNISFLLDVKIFFKTIFIVLLGKDIDDNVNKPRIAAEIIEKDK